MTQDLFDHRREEFIRKNAPLADRMRPRTLGEFVGQQHIIGEGRLLRRAIQIDQLSSLIFYGPPGTGKTTLARIIANTTKAHFISINAVLAGVKEIRDAIEQAQQTLSMYGKRTILFVDEVHRFNKSQQDALLPHVENGILILIGATTENPYFEVNKALVSRSRIFQLQSLTLADLKNVARQALVDQDRGYGKRKVAIEDAALDHLVQVASGDARGVLNALELAVETTVEGGDGTLVITRETIEDSIQRRAVLYDKDGDAHYDTISAFIKSMRGSDPDAALYWLAKMVYAGEEPRFIFRRMLILACEDVGMADPAALGVVMDAAEAFDYVGLPEGRYHLAHACLYLSTAPKSNSSMAFFDALNTVTNEAKDAVPDHLRDASRDKEGFGHGAGYLYPHAYRDHWVAQQYLPDALQGKLFYQPSVVGFEKKIAEQVLQHREIQLEAMVDQDDFSPLTAATGSAGEGEKSSRQLWYERSLGRRGGRLSLLREKLLTLASIKPDELVMDICTRTGILAFAAARIRGIGGVWACAHDAQSFETTDRIARKLDLLTRPQVVQTTWDTFTDDLRLVAGSSVGFDVVLGRSILTRQQSQEALLLRIAELLTDNGRIILAEPVPSEGQRLLDLVDCSALDASLQSRCREVECALFGDPADSMVNWNSRSLELLFKKLPGMQGELLLQDVCEKRTIKPADVEFWFRTEEQSQRLSFGMRLQTCCTSDELQTVKRLFHMQLDNNDVDWRMVTAFIRLKRIKQ